ncbi:hypothetical protein ZA91_005090 [Salmonella enterica subsp. enterica]|nr:hypothetical protein [Salmonella enterica subsp. enterica serovar Mikawasima]
MNEIIASPGDVSGELLNDRRKKTRLVRSGFFTVSGSELVALTGGSHSTPNAYILCTQAQYCN